MTWRRSRRCRPSTRRSSGTGTRGCARRTTSRSSSATTTGATCASCPTRSCRSAAAATACTTTSTTSAAAATTSGSTPSTSPTPGSSCNLAYTYGVDRLWVVNVGDMKNEELPAPVLPRLRVGPGPPGRCEQLGDWERQYAAQNFGADAGRRDRRGAARRTGTLQSRRKPELLNRRITLDPAKDLATDSSAVVYDDQGTPFSLDRLPARWTGSPRSGRRWPRGPSGSRPALPAAWQDAYYQLVYYQVKATANLYALRQRRSSPTSCTPRRAGPPPTTSPTSPRPGSPRTRR